MPRRLFAVLLVALSLSACDSSGPTECAEGDTCYTYLATDPSGVSAVTGSFSLSEEAGQITGLWRTQRIGGSDVGPQVGSGELVGQEEGDRVVLTLVSNVATGTVELIGVRGEGRITGQWTWLPPTGGVRSGTFDLFATGD